MSEQFTPCIACDCVDDDLYYSPQGAGPFCPDCWQSLTDPDQTLLLEKRLEASETQIERLKTELDDSKFRYQQEYNIVDRIWKLLGNPPYLSLKGRSLYDLVQEKIDEAEWLKTELAQTKELMLFAHENMVRQKDTLITQLTDKLTELRRSFDFIDKAVWEAHQVPELIEKAQALTPLKPTGTKSA